MIFNELEKCLDLLNVFKDKSIFLTECLLILPSKEKTLNDNDLEKINKLIIQRVENKTGAKIRS